jgi:hypothetical protein
MGIESDLQEIKKRNARVEADKAWETSWARKLLIGAMTYVLAGILFTMLNAQNPWLTAIVPALAFVVSTLTIPFFKKWWMASFYGSKKRL